MFVTFEGIDGSGKTTVAKMLVERLAAKGANAKYFKTPGQTKIGADLREMVLNPDNNLAPDAPFFLFVADMLQVNHECGLADGPEDNLIAICDRYKDSTLVYQVMCANRSPFEKYLMSQTLNEFVPDPDVTVLFEVKYETAQKRLKTQEFGKKDRFEDADRVKWENRQRAYMDLPERFPERKFVTIDVNELTAEQVVDKLLDELFLM